jgi:hypothetical protein
MKFVLGKPHPLVESDWYIVINEDSVEEIESRLQGNGKYMCESIALHSIKNNKEMPWTVAMAHVKASATCPILSRFGWYANRNGGMCDKLHDIVSEVEADKWPEKLTPEQLLRKIKISQYYGGKHWYAILPDSTHLEWKGQNRWLQARSARKAVREYLGI